MKPLTNYLPKKLIMYVEGKYLLLSYRDIPNTDFICENGGDLRIRVLKIPKSEITMLPEGHLLGAMDKWVLVFENISARVVAEQEEIIRAVQWYKSRFGLQSMNLLYL